MDTDTMLVFVSCPPRPDMGADKEQTTSKRLGFEKLLGETRQLSQADGETWQVVSH